MKRLTSSLTMLVAIFAAAPAFAADARISIDKPWARASIGTTTPTAAYLTIVNRSKVADRLLAVSTPAAGIAEIHLSEVKNGRATMRKVEGIAVPPGGKVALRPGGYHVMLMKLKRPIKKGTMLPLTLTFERAGKIRVRAMVMSPGARGHRDHKHH